VSAAKSNVSSKVLFIFVSAKGIDTAIMLQILRLLAQGWILKFRGKLSDKGPKSSPLRKVDVGLRRCKS